MWKKQGEDREIGAEGTAGTDVEGDSQTDPIYGCDPQTGRETSRVQEQLSVQNPQTPRPSGRGPKIEEDRRET